jgi:hypothetical protein
MKYLKSLSQLEELLQTEKAVILIFVDPNEFMPAKSLLNYLFAHPLMKQLDRFVYIWNLVDQLIYERYQVVAFPQMTILRGQEAPFSFIGYNREKANELLELFCQEIGLGKAQKQLNVRMTRCANSHEMSLVGEQRSGNYPGGCYKCNLCSKLSHFDKDRPSLHCQICSFDVCPLCCYEDVIV